MNFSKAFEIKKRIKYKKMTRTSISDGNRELFNKNYSNAMVHFIRAMSDYGGLTRVISSNIRLTQYYHRKNLKRLANTQSRSYFQRVGENTSEGGANDINTDGKCVEFSDHCIYFDDSSVDLRQLDIVEKLLSWTSKNPLIHIKDTAATPGSLLLGIFQKIVWRAKVVVVTERFGLVKIEKYLEEFATASFLAQVISLLGQIQINLIKDLGHVSGADSDLDKKNWPSWCCMLGQINDRLTKSGDEQFLNALSEIALGRSLQAHEMGHFLRELESKNSSRADLIRLVCIGEESIRHIHENVLPRIVSKNIYYHPGEDDIEPDEIDLPFHSCPKVSVLIPVYEKIEYTLACLKSIADHLPKVSFEVIVMDDRSPDESAKILQQVKNLRVILNPQNLGFLRSCNNGALHAQGEYLFFLNNDTQVQTGWLDELLDTFSNFSNCGLAGSKLIYPDGLLQEAGGIVWQDGSAWNYGNRKDPKLPQFNYAREVDYVSGAAIMVPAELFRHLGGFDERYAPAYYEDTDLALRIRTMGKSVIYQPMSEVIHFEGISSGTDTASGIKAFQVINREKFLLRWKDTLQRHRPNGVEPNLERDRGVKGRVLFIDACTPTPDQDSGSIDIYNLMRAFVEMGWAVSFIPEDNYAYNEKYTPALQKLGVQALYHPYIESVDDHITSHGASYDLIMSFRPLVTSKHFHNLRKKCQNAKIVFNTVDLHFLRLEREAALKNDEAIAKEALRLKAVELELMNLADLTTVVSSIELEILQKQGVQRVVHLPFSREIRASDIPFDARSGLIFVGGFQHNPNLDAVKYFVMDIMPLLRERIPGLILNIVGSNTPREIQSLACKDIVVHGFVEDLELLMGKMRLNIAPLRYGAGTKGKVVGAFASGVPTVGTALAYEGMGYFDPRTTVQNSSAIEFAEKIYNVYSESKVWCEVRDSCLELATRLYGLDALKINVRRLLDC